jgi:hypothetical protein
MKKLEKIVSTERHLEINAFLNGALHQKNLESEQMKELKNILQDLQCCGNCHNREKYICSGHLPCQVCDNWTSDGKTREERK